jgi:hypothetical protein
MLSNLQALKIVSILTMFISSQRRFTGSSKPQEHGMNAYETSLSLMASKSEKPILHSLLRLLQKICLYEIYVDDIIFGSTNKSTCEEFSRIMVQKFEMSMMGELKYFLGFQVNQLQEGTFISQTKYTQDILNKFGMKDAKPIKTPMGTNGHLDLDTGGKSVDQKVYRSMIGSLLYLCASRLDIMLFICMCARFQADPKEVHLRAMKRIMRYLVYTPKFGLWYPKGSTFDLIFHIGLIFHSHIVCQRGREFKGLSISPFLAIHAKGGESISPKQKDRTTTNFKIFEIKFSISIFQIGIPLKIISQLVSIFQIDIYLKTLLKAKRRISLRGSFV